VHQKPYAYFVKPSTLCGKTRVELGDILFIVKRLRSGKVRDHRFSFAQAKRLTNGAFAIEVHQFLFYRDLADIQFRFGNSVFMGAGATPLIWKNISASGWFGHYLFVDEHWPLVTKVARLTHNFQEAAPSFLFRLTCFTHLVVTIGTERIRSKDF
jgi:hypothetical protein